MVYFFVEVMEKQQQARKHDRNILGGNISKEEVALRGEFAIIKRFFSQCIFSGGDGWGVETGLNGIEQIYFFVEVVEKQSQSGKQDRTILGGNISGRGLFERGLQQCNKNLFSMHFLWHNMWRNCKKKLNLKYDSITGI